MRFPSCQRAPASAQQHDALAIAAKCTALGINYWDCPISGMPFRAKDGSLTVMFGGTAEAFGMAKPYLEKVGTTIVHCGPVGAGQAMKALTTSSIT